MDARVAADRAAPAWRGGGGGGGGGGGRHALPPGVWPPT